MRKHRVPSLLGILATLSAVFVIYASIVPMRYTPLSFAETWVRFQQIPWLQLGLEKRADWVANGLILIPFGFFLAGALHWRRRSLEWKMTSFALFAVLQALFVCAIEFVQVWFPPRVLSQNDMLAGYLGGLFGVLLWHGVGERVVDTVFRFASSPPGLPRFSILAQCCVVGLVLWGLLPFDVMLTPTEWGQKLASDRFNWIPFTDWSGVSESVKSILLCGWAFPLGVVLSLQSPQQRAIRQVIGWSVAVELASLPIYGRYTSVTDIIVAALLGWAGVKLAYPIRRQIDRLDLPITWLFAAVTWTFVILIGFTVRFERIVTDPQELSDRLWSILAVPFARAQRSTEFQAAENILLKLLVFGLLSFLLAGWLDGRIGILGRRSVWRIVIVVGWVAATGVAVEISQAFLVPLVPDVTDLLLYSAGGVLGVLGFRLLIPVRRW